MARARKRTTDLSPQPALANAGDASPVAATLALADVATVSGGAISNAAVGLNTNTAIAGSLHRSNGSPSINGSFNGSLGRDSVRGWHNGSSYHRPSTKPALGTSRSKSKSAAPARRAETREELAARVAKNLTLARASLDVTQEELAENSGVARATIAQIEAGASDARVGTLHDLASALKISPLLLLIHANDLTSIARWVNRSALAQVLDQLLPAEIERLNRLRETGLRKDLVRVAKAGVAAAEAAGFTSPAAVAGAGIGSTVAPGIGTAIGALLGAALDPEQEKQASLLEGGEGI